MGEAWRPAAARRGAMCRGMLHWAALRTNSSDQTSLSSATWSVSCSSGKPGMLRAHSTAEKRIRAANSQMLSMPIMLFEAIWIWPYLVAYGSARSRREM